MKSFNFWGISILMVLVSISAYCKDNPDKYKTEAIQSRLIQIEENYDDLLYKCLYSIDELRPFSIIQNDKISSMYSNKWLSPDIISSNLTYSDKENLIEKISAFLSDYEDKGKIEFILNKIQNWCISYIQFDVLINHFGIQQEQLIHSIVSINTSSLNPNTGLDNITDFNKFDSTEFEKSEYNALNYISNMKRHDLLEYFSKVFGKLSESAK